VRETFIRRKRGEGNQEPLGRVDADIMHHPQLLRGCDSKNSEI